MDLLKLDRGKQASGAPILRRPCAAITIAVQLFKWLDTMEAKQSRKRRRYSHELKAQILAECEVHGVSVAKVALAHGINANMVHGWRKLARCEESAVLQREFVPVAVAPTPQARCDDRSIELELRRGAMAIKLLRPMSEAGELAVFTQELLP